MRVFASTTYLGPGRTRLADALDGLDRLGLDGVELGSTHLWQDDFVNVARSWVRNWKGACVVHNYCPPAEDDLILNIASADDGQRWASVVHAKKCIAFAADIGSEAYTVHPGFLSDALQVGESRGGSAYDFTFAEAKTPRGAAFALMCDSLKELADDAARLDVRLAIETEGSVTRQGILLMETPAEYDALFAAIPEGLGLTLNLAHTTLASKVHGFSVADFIARFGGRFCAIEVSHNDGHNDSHAPLEETSYVLDWIPRLPDVPMILEFRDATPEQLARSAELLRSAAA